MSCLTRICLRNKTQDTHSHQYTVLTPVIIIPVTCICLLSSLGTIVGFCQRITLQFYQDLYTEQINKIYAVVLKNQQKLLMNNLYLLNNRG
jgi:uncharacterized protein YqkB